MTPSTERRILALATKLLGFTFELMPMDPAIWRENTSPVNHHIPKSYKWIGIVSRDGRRYSFGRFISAKSARSAQVRLVAYYLHCAKCDCSEVDRHPALRVRPWNDTHGQLEKVANG